MSVEDDELRALKALLDRIRGTPGGAADGGAPREVAGESSPPLELDLVEAFEGELLEDSFDGLAPIDVPPAAASRIVATGLPPRAGDEDFDDAPPAARRGGDPLAQTTQNPLPAAIFERIVRRGHPEEERSPASSPRPVDPAEAADVGLESEPPPESGEMASQRQPAVGSMRPHDLDLDEPTALAESEDLARALEARLRVEDALQPAIVVAAGPRTPPRIVARSPLAATPFLAVLDAALSFGER